MDHERLKTWFVSPTVSRNAGRALSARELLAKLEGDERDELQRAMRARDLEAVRALLARHSARQEQHKRRGSKRRTSGGRGSDEPNGAA